MAMITLHVNKAYVWEEVDKTCSYTGDKMTDDEAAYERIRMTDADQKTLQRFWEEAAAVASDQLKEMIVSSSAMTDDYAVCLEVSNSYDSQLTPSVETTLCSYFIASITGKWYKFSNKGEAESYLEEAASMMDDALRKLYSRKRPRRPYRGD